MGRSRDLASSCRFGMVTKKKNCLLFFCSELACGFRGLELVFEYSDEFLNVVYCLPKC